MSLALTDDEIHAREHLVRSGRRLWGFAGQVSCAGCGSWILLRDAHHVACTSKFVCISCRRKME